MNLKLGVPSEAYTKGNRKYQRKKMTEVLAKCSAMKQQVVKMDSKKLECSINYNDSTQHKKQLVVHYNEHKGNY